MGKPRCWLVASILLFSLLGVKGELRPPIITEHPSSIIVPKNEPITINCKADGYPEPVIHWYKDGQEVQTAPTHPHSHRVVLPTGSLFFLRVMQTRRDQDGGVYWCEAINEIGRARSMNATLDVAVMNDYFQMMPMSSRIAQGDTAVLKCLPPKANPAPEITWTKNEEPVNPMDSKRIHISETGNLVIKDVEKTDAGDYVCQAANMAGSRESDVATLSVHVRPYFVSEPEDVNAREGEDVTLDCQVSGDPAPRITWRREEGTALETRAVTDRDENLHIYSVLGSDEGVYYCTAENTVGTVTGSLSLTVHAEPIFLVRPAPKKVGLNGVAEFHCTATGSPTPTIFWTREGDQNLMFPGTSHGIFHVSQDGVLSINGVREEDQGYYVCSALSAAGSLSAKAYLEVRSLDNLPPPLIDFGPTNQTLPLHTPATLPCQSSGTPEPEVQWYKNSNPLTLQPPYIAVDNVGTLRIKELATADTGLYTCTASSGSGETSWSAYISVEDPKNPNIIFHRSPDPVTFPTAPSSVRIEGRSPTSLSLSWTPAINSGASTLIGYTVEYYSAEIQTGWAVAAYRVNGESYTVENLRPDTEYVFTVRAENSHGSSAPSPLSRSVKTTRLGSDYRLDENMEYAREVLLSRVLEIVDLEAISSTSVRITWNLLSDTEYIQGFYIRFCDMSGGSIKFNIITILKDSVTNNYVVANLREFTKYEFFLMPFYKSIEGQPSNSRQIQTLEDIPSAPPGNLRAGTMNSTAAIISWTPPPPQHRNGVLQLYHVKIETNRSVHADMRINATTTSIVVANFSLDTTYIVRAVAYTNKGAGPFSTPVFFTLDLSASLNSVLAGYGPQFEDIGAQTWFIALIAGILFVLVVLFIMLIIYRQMRTNRKGMDHQCIKDFDDTAVKTYRADNLWITQTDHQTFEKQAFIRNGLADKEDAGSSIYAEVGDGEGRHLSTFSNHFNNINSKYQDPEPYATTTLAVQNRYANQDGYLNAEYPEATGQLNLYKTGSSSGGSSLNSKPSTGSGSGAYIPNWSEMFPPPPDYPPSESEASLRLHSAPWNKNVLISSHVGDIPVSGSGQPYASGHLGSQSHIMPGHLSLSGHSGSQGQMTGPELGWSLVDNPLDSFNQSYQDGYRVDSSNYMSDIYENPSEHYAALDQSTRTAAESVRLSSWTNKGNFSLQPLAGKKAPVKYFSQSNVRDQ